MKLKKNLSMLLMGLVLAGTVITSNTETFASSQESVKVYKVNASDFELVDVTEEDINSLEPNKIISENTETYDLNLESVTVDRINASDLELVDATEEELNMPEISLNSLSRVNYNDVTLNNGASMSFTNYGGAYWSIPAGTWVQFYFELPTSGVYYEVGYINDSGQKSVIYNNVKGSGAQDFSIYFNGSTNVKFYIKNTQSDPFTVKNIKVNFPV